VSPAPALGGRVEDSGRHGVHSCPEPKSRGPIVAIEPAREKTRQCQNARMSD
jgi:hypothetical protein